MSHRWLRGGRAERGIPGRLPVRSAGLVPWALLAAVACGGGRHHPSDLSNDGTLDLDDALLDAGVILSHADDPALDAAAEEVVSDGGLTTVALDASTPAQTSTSTCGDGTIDPGEECDPGLAPTESCEPRGFDTGLLGCTSECHFSTASCSGVENCSDGRDNDGDGLADCADADCSGACADACQSPVVVSENASVSGTTLGHPASLAASCSDAAPSGAEVVYQVTATEDGKIDVSLASDQPLNSSLRSSCADVASELACGSQTRLTLDAVAGQTYFILVDGASAAAAGTYRLELRARQQACGDGIRDADEECDDGNTRSVDGCDSDCLLELSESESNNRRSRADAFDFTPWFAQINPVADVDYYRVSLSAVSSTLVVETLDLGDGACALNAMDPVVDILDTNTNGNALLTRADNGGEGKCARAIATGLPAGAYYVRVQAAAGALPATFPYRLEMSVGVCGDGDPTLGEGCDDGNQTSGDGCDSNCQVEPGP